VEREKFMQEARITAHRILEGKENGIMNLVQQAWAEGKRNAEVETLKQAVVEAFCNGSTTIDESHNVGYVEPTYTTWGEYLCNIGLIHDCKDGEQVAERLFNNNIPTEIAQKLELKPVEVHNETD
jgi:hypothetical protein